MNKPILEINLEKMKKLNLSITEAAVIKLMHMKTTNRSEISELLNITERTTYNIIKNVKEKNPELLPEHENISPEKNSVKRRKEAKEENKHVTDNNVTNKPLTSNKLTSNSVNSNKSTNDNRRVKPPKSYEDEARELMDHFNEVYGKSRRSINPLIAPTRGTKYGLFEYWRRSYSLEEMKKAVTLSKSHNYWKKAVAAKGPTVLLRMYLPKGDPADYMGDLLNQEEEESDTVKQAREVYGDITIV